MAARAGAGAAHGQCGPAGRRARGGRQPGQHRRPRRVSEPVRPRPRVRAARRTAAGYGGRLDHRRRRRRAVGERIHLRGHRRAGRCEPPGRGDDLGRGPGGRGRTVGASRSGPVARCGRRLFRGGVRRVQLPLGAGQRRVDLRPPPRAGTASHQGGPRACYRYGAARGSGVDRDSGGVDAASVGHGEPETRRRDGRDRPDRDERRLRGRRHDPCRGRPSRSRSAWTSGDRARRRPDAGNRLAALRRTGTWGARGRRAATRSADLPQRRGIGPHNPLHRQFVERTQRYGAGAGAGRPGAVHRNGRPAGRRLCRSVADSRTDGRGTRGSDPGSPRTGRTGDGPPPRTKDLPAGPCCGYLRQEP